LFILRRYSAVVSTNATYRHIQRGGHPLRNSDPIIGYEENSNPCYQIPFLDSSSPDMPKLIFFRPGHLATGDLTAHPILSIAGFEEAPSRQRRRGKRQEGRDSRRRGELEVDCVVGF